MSGYKDPPKKTQFKPGISGNPNGRPKGVLSLATWIQKLAEDEDFQVLLQHPTKGYVTYKGAPIKAVVEVAWRRAAAGDKDAREWLAKYGYGTKLELSGRVNGNITVNLVKFEDGADASTQPEAS